LLSKGTKTALNKVKLIDKSLKSFGRAGTALGVVGSAITIGTTAYGFFNGKDLTYGQIFDMGLTVGLTILTVSNPIGLVALGVYGVLDAGGAFDGIKESLGANNVAVESTYK
jgi:hypothetical protein